MCDDVHADRALEHVFLKLVLEVTLQLKDAAYTERIVLSRAVRAFLKHIKEVWRRTG